MNIAVVPCSRRQCNLNLPAKCNTFRLWMGDNGRALIPPHCGIWALLPIHLLPFPLFSSTTRTVHILTPFDDASHSLLVLFLLRLFDAPTMREITYPLYPIIVFFGSILVLIPLPWHLQAWNSGTCYFIFWTCVACLNQFLNSVVWASDMVDRAPWFCEICS